MQKQKIDYNNLKERLYLNLYNGGVAVFAEDVLSPTLLTDCGFRLPISGDKLLLMLIELVQEGKLVVWRDNETFGFLPAEIWQQELVIISDPALREACNSMLLSGEELKKLSNYSIGSIATFSMNKAAGNPLEYREKKLDEAPDNHDRETYHKPANNTETTREESVVPTD